MKKITLTIMSLLYVSPAFALNMSQLAGCYDITSEVIPGVVNYVDINSKGDIKKYIEHTPHGMLECTGDALMVESNVESQLNCEVKGVKVNFEQKINLTDITNFNKFEAPVYSSVFKQEFVMNFEKVACR